MGQPKIKFISQKEYLDAERQATEKHEYFNGEIFPLFKNESFESGINAMSGASIAHNEIATNCIYELKSKLKGKPCRPYGSDFRVNIPKNTLYTYPDISVFCSEPETLDNELDTATNPSVIIEILSKSTRNYDLGEKFSLYRAIDSLKEYILIDSEDVKVIIHSKNANGSWLLTEFSTLSESFFIPTLKIDLKLIDIYENVKFA